MEVLTDEVVGFDSRKGFIEEEGISTSTMWMAHTFLAIPRPCLNTFTYTERIASLSSCLRSSVVHFCNYHIQYIASICLQQLPFSMLAAIKQGGRKICSEWLLTLVDLFPLHIHRRLLGAFRMQSCWQLKDTHNAACRYVELLLLFGLSISFE